MFRKKSKLELRPALSDGETQRLKQLLAYCAPYADSEPLHSNPATPADFVDHDFSSFAWLFEGFSLPPSPGDIRAALLRDTAPIPATINREGYCGDNHLHYWLSGFAEYLRLTAMAAEHGVTGGQYLDFGGSTGRLFRNFHFQSNDWGVWSSDFKMTSVTWNLDNMPSAIRVFLNGYLPILPIEDRSIDLITAMSVFTHIDETETGWLMELRRILRPGGIAIITIHSEDTWQHMPRELRSVIERFSPELAANSVLPPGRSVSNFRTDDPYRCNTFHTTDFVRRQWGRYFEVCKFVPRASGAQTAVIMRKP